MFEASYKLHASQHRACSESNISTASSTVTTGTSAKQAQSLTVMKPVSMAEMLPGPSAGTGVAHREQATSATESDEAFNTCESLSPGSVAGFVAQNAPQAVPVEEGQDTFDSSESASSDED